MFLIYCRTAFVTGFLCGKQNSGDGRAKCTFSDMVKMVILYIVTTLH